jgi:uncharacterized protein YrrD
MLYEATTITGLPIISLDSGQVLGSVADIIIDPENGKILGITSGSGFFNKSKKALAFNDIFELNHEAVLTRDDESLVNIDELVRIKNVIGQKIYLIGSKVVNEEGKRLGRVADFIINADLGILSKIYVENSLHKRYFEDTLVIPAKKIISIERKKIIVCDDYEREKCEESEILEEAVPT